MLEAGFYSISNNSLQIKLLVAGSTNGLTIFNFVIYIFTQIVSTHIYIILESDQS